MPRLMFVIQTKERVMPTRYFTQAVFEFLKELALNNNKPWWEENKERYINTIREPALDFVTDFGPETRGDLTTFPG